jgi:hypothetical protein
MRRDIFLKTCVSAGILIATPFRLMAAAVQKFRVEMDLK